MKTLEAHGIGTMAPTPKWPRALPPGPDARARLTEGYARLITRDAYFWAWPLINLHARRLALVDVAETGLAGGGIPIAPLNRICVPCDRPDAGARRSGCPSPDLIIGTGVLALDDSPVVIQVPDFGRRFWVYSAVDLRTDSFADLGVMHDTKPGFYLLAGPSWRGRAPRGITQMFRARTATALVTARVFVDDTPEDRAAILGAIQGIDMYPLAMFDGVMKRRDWRQVPRVGVDAGDGRRVSPERFVEQLAAVLHDAPALPGEEARYAQMRVLVEAAGHDSLLAAAIVEEVTRVERELVAPLHEFRNTGVPLAHHWSTIANGAVFGTDYFARTATARSNILIEKPTEVRCYYQDLDRAGARLDGGERYTLTFARDQLPPARAFWSVALYDAHHCLVANPIGRHAIGSRTRFLQPGPDGSLTIFIQSDAPDDPAQHANWLPAPANAELSLVLRVYWPDTATRDGAWGPPPVEKSERIH